MKTTYLQIPTHDPEMAEGFDYSRSYPIAMQEVDGIRIVMGDADDVNAPDVLIERDVGLWRVFVHPDRGDPLCIVEIERYKAKIQDERGATLLEKTLP